VIIFFPDDVTIDDDGDFETGAWETDGACETDACETDGAFETDACETDGDTVVVTLVAFSNILALKFPNPSTRCIIYIYIYTRYFIYKENIIIL
jgi:hypothetical protein